MKNYNYREDGAPVKALPVAPVKAAKLKSPFERALETKWSEGLYHVANVAAVLTGVMALTALVVMFL